MSQSPAKREGPNPLEWVESAMRLLRSAPPGALLCYYIGSAPCLLGLLYFWADMSRGAFAAERLVESAFNVAALYIWMKCWQAVFLSKLRAHLFMEKDEPWTMARVGRMALIQASVQPPGLFLRFIAANVLIPYVWTYSFFAGAAILGDGRERGSARGPALCRIAEVRRAADEHLSSLGIERNVAEAQQAAEQMAGPAQQRLQARDQLLHRERLGEIVVGALPQPRHAVAHAIARGQDQHRGCVMSATNLAQQREPVLVR